MSDTHPSATACWWSAKLILFPSHQVNPILYKHKRLHGSFYVGLGESQSIPNPTVNGALSRSLPVADSTCLTFLPTGRQARRSIRTTTIKWLLLGHVKHIPPVGQAFDGFSQRSLNTFPRYTPSCPSDFVHYLYAISTFPGTLFLGIGWERQKQGRSSRFCALSNARTSG